MCLGLALACLVMSGCGSLPVPREMGDMALLRTMGVDSQEGELLVTVSTGPRARGLQGEQQPALMLSAQGRTRQSFPFRDSATATCSSAI